MCAVGNEHPYALALRRETPLERRLDAVEHGIFVRRSRNALRFDMRRQAIDKTPIVGGNVQ